MKVTVTFEIPEVLKDNIKDCDLSEPSILVDTDEKYTLFRTVLKAITEQIDRNKKTLEEIVSNNDKFSRYLDSLEKNHL